jgi:hypothetical protein
MLRALGRPLRSGGSGALVGRSPSGERRPARGCSEPLSFVDLRGLPPRGVHLVLDLVKRADVPIGSPFMIPCQY